MDRNQQREVRNERMESDNRRTFLMRLTAAVTGAGALVASWPLVRSLIPNVLYEPPRRFSVGDPNRFQEGVTFLDEQRIFLFRNGNTYHAISGICTHLGCTVKFAPYSQQKEETARGVSFNSLGEFHCPCHGSKFRGEGTNYEGPAPGPLKWFRLELSSANGELLIDIGQEVDRDFRLVV
jgi:menaquinol-cytochrome c reductase iron-sulfur subunit